MSHSVLSISWETVEELRSKVTALAKELGVGVDVTTAQLELRLPPASVRAVEPEVVATRRPRGPARDEAPNNPVGAKAAPAKEIAPAPEPTEVDLTGHELTREDVDTAVRGVIQKLSVKPAQAILAKFGAKNTAGVKAEDYAALVDACSKALAA